MKQKMKLVAAIVAGMCAVSAQAGQLAGNPSTIYAAEKITNTAFVPVPTFTYQTSEPINGPVAGTNTIYVVFKAASGTWAGSTVPGAILPASLPAAGTFPTVRMLAAASGSNTLAIDLNGVGAASAVIGGVTYTSSTVATPSDTLVYSFTIPTGAIYGLGSNFYFGSDVAVGGLTAAPGIAGSTTGATTAATSRIGYLTGLSAALGMGSFIDCAPFVGGEVKVKAIIGNSTGGQTDTIAPADPEKVLLKSALGVAIDVTASADTTKIDATGASSKSFTGANAAAVGSTGAVTNAANLATLKLTTAAPVTTDISGVAYNVASTYVAANTLRLTVVGDFSGQTAAVGRFSLAPAANCSGAAVAANTVTLDTAKTTATVDFTGTNAALPASGVAAYLCYTPSNAVVLVPAAFTVSATFLDATPAAFNYGKLSAGGVCPAVTWNSALNASKVIVRNYSSAAANAYGWNQYTRIINSGTVDAAVTGYYQYGDGSVGTEKQIVSMVKKGGNVTIQNTAIEALLGAPVQPAGVTTNPRLVIQSPTSALRVQNYIVMPNGAWFEASAAQTENASGSTNTGATTE